MGPSCGHRSLKTQTQLICGAEGMAGRMYSPRGSSWASETRASGRRSFRLLSLDVVSGIAVDWRGGLRDCGRVSLSGDLSQLPRVWGHFVGRVESCCLAHVSLQERDSRAEPQVRAGRLENSNTVEDWVHRGLASPICGLLAKVLTGLSLTWGSC